MGVSRNGRVCVQLDIWVFDCELFKSVTAPGFHILRLPVISAQNGADWES